MPTQDTCVSIGPYFKAAPGKMDEAKRLCERLVQIAQSEPDCLYYGFAFNGDEIYCREGYNGAAGVLGHLNNIATTLSELLNISSMVRLEVHGVEAELAKLRQHLAPFNPTYYALEYGIRK